MTGYDIDFLRPLRKDGNGARRGPGRAATILFTAGILFYVVYAAASLGAARARLDREAALLERERDLVRRTAAADTLFERNREALLERAGRIPWAALLGSIARAVPEGERIDRIAYDGEAGSLAVVWSPSDGGARAAFARSVRGDSFVAGAFPLLRTAKGEEADTLLLLWREER